MELRIDWSEIDAFGHINNLAIMKYVQTARVNHLELIGLLPLDAANGIGPVLASTSCQFRRQLFYPGKVVVHSVIDHVKTTSFHMNHTVVNEAQELIAEAHDALVLYNFRKKAKHPISAVLRERMQATGKPDGEGPLASPPR